MKIAILATLLASSVSAVTDQYYYQGQTPSSTEQSTGTSQYEQASDIKKGLTSLYDWSNAGDDINDAADSISNYAYNAAKQYQRSK